MLNKSDKAWFHSMFLKYYGTPKAPREVCIRCGSRAVLGKRNPYLGLCRKCRKQEFKEASK